MDGKIEKADVAIIRYEETASRMKEWNCPEMKIKEGYLSRYAMLVSSAINGAVLDVKV